jgi:L-lactate dehydrogenase complex protein LldG
MATEARAEVLQRIRAAVGGASDAAAVAAEWAAIARGYKRTATLGQEDILELLEDRLRDYDATVVRARFGEIAAAVALALAERGKRRLVVPQGLAEWLGQALPAAYVPPIAKDAIDGAPGLSGLPGLSFEFIADDGMTAAELDGFEGVVTGSTVAIAETGTIVLQTVAGQGRRVASLVPDYHLCVVRAGDVVETVPEAMARLAGTANLATEFISGP